MHHYPLYPSINVLTIYVYCNSFKMRLEHYIQKEENEMKTLFMEALHNHLFPLLNSFVIEAFYSTARKA
jgi:hypothetical protein